MAAKQSRTDGSRKENPEHWISELMISVVFREMGGSVSVRSRSEELTFMALVGRVSEVTIGHRQGKPINQRANFKSMVLILTN